MRETLGALREGHSGKDELSHLQPSIGSTDGGWSAADGGPSLVKRRPLTDPDDSDESQQNRYACHGGNPCSTVRGPAFAMP